MNLENEILQLCFDVLEKEITPWEAQKEILRLLDVVGRSEQLSCGRNITTCVFYKDGGKCSSLEYCRDQIA